MKIIIVGAGEVGFHIAGRLSLENKDVVVIDAGAEATRRVSETIDAQVIHGSGSSPVILEEAGVSEAEILLAVTNSDETNLVACMVADLISASTKKLARIRNADFDKYHEAFRTAAPHIDMVINPEIEVVNTIEQFMSVPGAVDVGTFAGGRVRFVGIKLDSDTPLSGVRLSELSEKIGGPIPLIAAVNRDDALLIPGGDDQLMPGDVVYIVSEAGKLAEAVSLLGKPAESVRRVLIIGGGRIGLRLASLLEDRPVHTKLIERDSGRCNELAEILDKAVILHGDGTDNVVLSEERIQEMDVVVTVTDDEQTNVLASLLAKRLGARNTITRINSFRYFSLMSAIGIEQIVSPRLSAINSILRHIRRGKVFSAISIKGEHAEVIEAEALETSDIVDKPLSDIDFPPGALVTVIIRGDDTIIPTGDSVIKPGDRIVIFGTREAIPKLEKFLTVKLEYF